MFDIQTELHLRRIGRNTAEAGSGVIRTLLVLAYLSALGLLALALL